MQNTAPRAADRHRRRDVSERDVGEQRLHVAALSIGDAAVADLAERLRVVGVPAHQRRHVEGDGQASPAGVEDHLVSLVGVLGAAEPGELADRPRPPPVARGIEPAGERELPRPADALEAGNVAAGRRSVHRLDRKIGHRGEVCVALRARVETSLPPFAARLDLRCAHPESLGARPG
jgi:hypothetical protein